MLIIGQLKLLPLDLLDHLFTRKVLNLTEKGLELVCCRYSEALVFTIKDIDLALDILIGRLSILRMVMEVTIYFFEAVVHFSFVFVVVAV